MNVGTNSSVMHGKNLDPSTLIPDSNDRATIRSIQIMRFAAAFAVVIYHSHLHLVGLQSGYTPNIVDRIFQVGASGVHVFFVISGFVMVLTSFKGSKTLTPIKFLQRRFLRIYPIYWLTACTYIGVHFAIGSSYSLSVIEYIGALFLIPSFGALIIGPGWTLAYECYFYFAFSAALTFGQRWTITALTIFFSLSIMVGVIFKLRDPVFSILTNILLLEFLAGCALGACYRKRLELPLWLGLLLMFFGIAGLAGSIWIPPSFPLTPVLGPSSLMIVAGALIIEPLLKGSISRFFAVLGDSSYLLYLIHILTIDILLTITPIANLNYSPNLAILLSFPFALVASVMAVVFHLVIETPLLNFLKPKKAN